MKRIALVTFITVTLSTLCTSAQAVIVRGQMHGLIAEHAWTSGIGHTVFGLDGAALLGQPFTVDFRYDTDLAPLSSSLQNHYDARAFYGSFQTPTDPAQNWLEMSITVNNITHKIMGDFQYSDVLDTFPNCLGCFGDYFQLAVDSGTNNYVGTFRRQFLDVSVNLPKDTFSGTALPTSIYWNQINPVGNSASFRINDFDVDLSTNTLTYERYVDFNMDIQLVEASVVPLPTALWLFGSGLLGLIGIARRKAA